MNTHYYQALVAFLLAQLLVTSVMVYRYQKEKNITYGSALRTYLVAEIGYFIIGIVGIFAILFILSDFIDLSITREDLKSKAALSWKETAQLYFKTIALFVGGLVQYIAFVYRDRGKNAIDKVADKLL